MLTYLNQTKSRTFAIQEFIQAIRIEIFNYAGTYTNDAGLSLLRDFGYYNIGILEDGKYWVSETGKFKTTHTLIRINTADCNFVSISVPNNCKFNLLIRPYA